MKHFIDGDVIYWDTETTGLNAWCGDQPFAFSFANQNLETRYFEFNVNPFTRQVDYLRHYQVLNQIRRLLEDSSITKVGHNTKFDVRMVELNCGIKVAGPGGRLRDGGYFGDTMFKAHACDTLEPNYKLKDLCTRYGVMNNSDQDLLQKNTAKMRLKAKKLGWKIAFSMTERPNGEIRKKGEVEADYWTGRTMHRLHPELASEWDAGLCEDYAVKDAIRTAYLDMMYEQVMDDLGVRHTWEFEQRLWPIVYSMEERGVRIDPVNLAKEVEDCLARQKRLDPLILSKAWPGFNIDSHHDLRKLLYDKEYLGLYCKPERKTKTGIYSVDVDALNDHRGHPVVMNILRHRGAGKAFSFFKQYARLMRPDPICESPRFVELIRANICKPWMVLHPDFRQLGPATGRFSCANPNVQQVTSIESSRSAEPIDGRHSFGPRPGYVWLHIDYKGMEIVVFAFIAQEPNMLRAIAEGREIHDEVCDRGWGGEGNEAGLIETIHVLGLDGSELGSNEELKGLWKQWEITDWRKLTDENRRYIANEWLRGFNWSIIKSQESIGKKVTKNKGKMVSFAKIYGGGADAVKDLLHVSKWEAQEFLYTYDRAFPRINEFAKEAQYEARQVGCCYSLWDRRMTILPDKAYRCVNYRVQGSCADLLKSAMYRSYHFLKGTGLDAHLIMTIHDELVFEIHKSCFSYKLVGQLCGIMEDSEGRIGVPMKTDPSYVTKEWAHKTKLKLDRRLVICPQMNLAA